MGGAPTTMGGAISLRRCSFFDAPPPDRAARATSFADARSMAPLKVRVGPRGEGTRPPRECSMTTSARAKAVCCSALEALARYSMPVKGHAEGRQATTVKTMRRMRASTLRLTARVMVVMGVPLSLLDEGGGEGDGEGDGGGGDDDGEGGGGGDGGEGVTRGGGEGGEGGGAATTMVGADSTVMPSWEEAAVAVRRAAESTACTWMEVVEAGTAVVWVMLPEAVVKVMVTAEASAPAVKEGARLMSAVRTSRDCVRGELTPRVAGELGFW